MYVVSAQGVYECIINGHYCCCYYYQLKLKQSFNECLAVLKTMMCEDHVK